MRRFPWVGPIVLAATLPACRPDASGVAPPRATPTLLAATLPPARAADAPPAGGRAPEVWAVVVGIGSYRDKIIPPCPGAAGDARAVQRWLTRTAGWRADHVLLMDEDSRREHPANPAQGIADLYPS